MVDRPEFRVNKPLDVIDEIETTSTLAMLLRLAVILIAFAGVVMFLQLAP
jgi:hypothetical protein